MWFLCLNQWAGVHISPKWVLLDKGEYDACFWHGKFQAFCEFAWPSFRDGLGYLEYSGWGTPAIQACFPVLTNDFLFPETFSTWDPCPLAGDLNCFDLAKLSIETPNLCWFSHSFWRKMILSFSCNYLYNWKTHCLERIEKKRHSWTGQQWSQGLPLDFAVWRKWIFSPIRSSWDLNTDQG